MFKDAKQALDGDYFLLLDMSERFNIRIPKISNNKRWMKARIKQIDQEFKHRSTHIIMFFWMRNRRWKSQVVKNFLGKFSSLEVRMELLNCHGEWTAIFAWWFAAMLILVQVQPQGGNLITDIVLGLQRRRRKRQGYPPAEKRRIHPLFDLTAGATRDTRSSTMEKVCNIPAGVFSELHR